MSANDAANAAGEVVDATTNAMFAPVNPLASSMRTAAGTAPASVAGLGEMKKSLGEKTTKARAEEFDVTDNDTCYLFELAKLAISQGADIEKIDLMKMAPAFEAEKRQNTKKYTAQRVVGFFTGGTFTFLVYLLLDKIFV
jgi:hypothetical protein